MVKLEAVEKLRAIAPLAEEDEDGNGGNGADSNGAGREPQ
jgi:hypothetical protein